jgi:NifU-like protein
MIMWDYTDKVKDFYAAPRNVGRMENADVEVLVGSIICGDALKLFLKIDENDIITDARFQVFGCGSAIAASSALTELIKGRSVEEAARLSNREIAEHLGGLPEEKMHCSVMGREAIEKAIRTWRGESVGDDEETEGRIICQCFSVTDTLIRKVIRQNSLSEIEEVTHYTKAAGACGACMHKIKDILNEELAIRKLAGSLSEK